MPLVFDLEKTILEKEGQNFVKALRAQLVKYNRNASGKLSRSLRSEVVENSTKLRLLVYGESYIEQLELGRNPTQRAGGGEPFTSQKIAQWILDKKIKISGSLASVAYAIWQKINKRGYEGTKGLITDVVSPAVIKNIIQKIGEKTANLTAKTIIQK